MASICRDFSQKAQWLARWGIEPSTALRDVADTFTLLQQLRHDADYDPRIDFSRARSVESVQLATAAIRQWRDLRGTSEADFFLLAMLLGRPRRG